MGSAKSAVVEPDVTGFDRLLFWRHFPGVFHALLYAALAFLIYFAFAPGQRGEGNLATEVVWKLWWPGLPFILLIGGRVWCGVCPFGGLSDMAGRTGSGRHAPPRLLRRWGPWLGIVSVFGFGLAFLSLGLEMNSGATGIILIGMIAIAVGLSLAYKGRTFCRYLCPVGMITRVYSFFSWLRPRGGLQKSTAVCPVGQSPESLRQPSQCHLCGTCTSSTASGGIRTSAGFAALRVPGRLEFGVAEAGLSLMLLGLMAADSVRMTSMFARFQQAALPVFGYNYRLTVIAGVSGLVGAVFALNLLVTFLGSRGAHRTSTFESAAFAYVPLTLGVFLALALQHLWSGAWPSLQTILVESRLIDWAGHMPPKNVYFTSIPLKSIQFLMLATGLFFSLRLALSGAGGKDGMHTASTDGDSRAGKAMRGAMVLMAAGGFGFLFVLPMSGAC